MTAFEKLYLKSILLSNNVQFKEYSVSSIHIVGSVTPSTFQFFGYEYKFILEYKSHLLFGDITIESFSFIKPTVFANRIIAFQWEFSLGISKTTNNLIFST